jgi:hypothetical protein
MCCKTRLGNVPRRASRRQHLAGALIAAVAGTVVVPPLSAQTRTENFDTAPAHWQLFNTSDYGFSNTNNTVQTSAAGEAGGRFRRLQQRDYYADTTIGVMTQDDAFSATGELFVGNGATADNEAMIAHFSTDTASSNSNVVGFAFVEGRPDASTGFRFMPHIWDSGGNDLRPTSINHPYVDEGGNPILYRYFYEWDPATDTLTTRLLNPDGSLVEQIQLDAPGVTFTVNAFGLTGIDTPGQDTSRFMDVFMDAVTYSISSPVVGSTWNVDADGDWSNAGNWTGGAPNSVGATANFGSVITAARTVTVDSPQTVGSINFDNANTYTIAGANAITLDTTSGQAAINVTSGSHVVSAPIVLNDDLSVTTAAGGGVAVTGAMTATGRNVTKAGAGTAQFANVRASGLSVTEGVARISAKGTPNDPSGTSVVNTYNILAGAQLDLTNNSMIVDYTGLPGLIVEAARLHLQSGRLTSSSADASRRIGYGDNGLLGKATFAGQTVDSTSLLVKFTYAGDANLDGQVDITDLGALATAWQTSNVWTGGDFDYTGFVDITDLGMLATNWQAGVGSPLRSGSLAEALAGLGLPSVSVPEPAAILGVLGLSAWVRRPDTRCGRMRAIRRLT